MTESMTMPVTVVMTGMTAIVTGIVMIVIGIVTTTVTSIVTRGLIMETIAIFLAITIASTVFFLKRDKPKPKELPPKISAKDEAIGDLIWYQVGESISRLSPIGKAHLIERIRQLPEREVNKK